MEGFDKIPVSTTEPAGEASKKWETPREVFVGTVQERLAQLVEDGKMSPEFARERLEAAKLIEEGLTDPTQQAVQFAEIGLDNIQRFREARDSALDDVKMRIGDTLRETRQGIVDLGDDKNKADLRRKFEQLVKVFEDALADITAKIEQTKKLL
jgi:hypothetical protein